LIADPIDAKGTFGPQVEIPTYKHSLATDNRRLRKRYFEKLEKKIVFKDLT